MQIVTFYNFFKGDNRAYGVYNVNTTDITTGKKLGERYTKYEPVTIDLYEKHIQGKQGLGIIPIMVNSKCNFGVIDIDDYNVDYMSTIKKINKNKLPLIPIRSKSGGLQLYCFFSEEIDAAVLKLKLKHIAAFLGHAKNPNGTETEIFPKQAKILAERGDIGSWINLPYFNGIEGGRYAYSSEGKPLDLSSFLELAKSFLLTTEQFNKLISDELKTNDLNNCPPCLEHLIQQGFPDGCRNNGLYNLGVYAKKAYPDSWEAMLEEYNVKYMKPQLDSASVQCTIKSLQKKEYNYSCSTPPINGYCNAQICRLRQYGVGDDQGLPSFGTLTKLQTDPPIWFLDVTVGDNIVRLELTTEELQTPLKFQKKCIEVANVMPPIPKRDVWQRLVQKALDTVIPIDVPEDSSSSGQLLEYLDRFCTMRAQARTKEEIIFGKPYRENDYVYFRMSDFYEYLNRQRFTEVKQNKIVSILKQNKTLEPSHVFWRIKEKGVNLWRVTIKLNNDPLALPDEIMDGNNDY